jgi:twinkle protein
MAKAFELVIILVAHPRKSNGTEFDNDSVSGSADITNKVDIVMSYDRGKGMADDERLMVVSKNRLTDKLAFGENGIKIYYSDKSRRISTNRQRFDKVFVPELEIRNIEMQEELPDEIPY